LNYFFDTSALVKIYHQENESEDVVGVYRSVENIFLSELSVIEYHSVVYRKFRENLLDENDLDKILTRFEIDLKERFNLLMFNPGVIDSARAAFHALGKKIFIRSLDAIQLGFFKSYLSPSDVFMTFDSRQGLAYEELLVKHFFYY